MDAVDFFSAQWLAERPGLDVEPIAIWGRLKRAASLLDDVIAEALAEHDLNLAEFEVLSALVRSGAPYEIRPTELTQSLIVTAGAVTARLNQLERRGLIARRHDENDRRVQLVTLSARGLLAFEPAFRSVLEVTGDVVHTLEAEGRTELFDGLKLLLGVLDDFSAASAPALPES